MTDVEREDFFRYKHGLFFNMNKSLYFWVKSAIFQVQMAEKFR